ncbi:MAG: glycerol-3-phosphate 1-O-acyltransferase PlsY [Bacteroidales bacterium]|jgi:glycerol-3-phosphate acyltransferase PlsY|nr:glycerol-3-phosphate 1-O-acyltransferase PlsY [Bacteroidales bacterium]
MGATATTFLYIGLTISAYLIGSVSNSIIFSGLIYHIDIRNYGSKNPGANNVQRILGWPMGLLVLALDILKGVVAVSLVFLLPFERETNAFVAAQIVFGTAAVIGHIFPVYHGFHGGKGVATTCGALLAMHPFAVLLCTIVFLIVFFITKYVSVSVITAVTCFPIMVNLLFAMWLEPRETLTLKIFSIVIGVTIWLSHISNLKRLWHGKEEKFFIKAPPGRNSFL